MTRASHHAIVIACAIVAACAAGGTNGPDDAPHGSDGSIRHDAAILPHDARPPLDAHLSDGAVPHDAPSAIDGNVSGACADNTQCASGTCCYFFVCQPGLAVGSNLCFPN